jgi:hypothetical protein
MLPPHLSARTRLALEPLQQLAAVAYSEGEILPRPQHLGSEDLAVQLHNLRLEAALRRAQAVCSVPPSQLSELRRQAVASLVVVEVHQPVLDLGLPPLASARVRHRLSEVALMLQMKELAKSHSRNSQRKILLPQTQPTATKPFPLSTHTSNGRWKSCG